VRCHDNCDSNRTSPTPHNCMTQQQIASRSDARNLTPNPSRAGRGTGFVAGSTEREGQPDLWRVAVIESSK
jgi:hypothetical protein